MMDRRRFILVASASTTLHATGNFAFAQGVKTKRRIAIAASRAPISAINVEAHVFYGPFIEELEQLENAGAIIHQ